MRDRNRDLPELELLSIDEEEPAPEVTTVDLGAKRWWPVALGGLLIAGAIFVTGRGGAPDDVAAAPSTPSTASTLFTPATRDVPSARSAAAAERRSYPAVLISADATAVIVLSQGARSKSTSPSRPTRSPDMCRGRRARS